jgi:hypothetical protein
MSNKASYKAPHRRWNATEVKKSRAFDKNALTVRTARLKTAIEAIFQLEEFGDPKNFQQYQEEFDDLSMELAQIGAAQFPRQPSWSREVANTISVLSGLKRRHLTALDYASISRFITRASFQRQLDLTGDQAEGVYNILVEFLYERGEGCRGEDSSGSGFGVAVLDTGIPVLHEVMRGFSQLLITSGRHLPQHRVDVLSLLLTFCQDSTSDDDVCHAAIDAIGNFFLFPCVFNENSNDTYMASVTVSSKNLTVADVASTKKEKVGGERGYLRATTEEHGNRVNARLVFIKELRAVHVQCAAVLVCNLQRCTELLLRDVPPPRAGSRLSARAPARGLAMQAGVSSSVLAGMEDGHGVNWRAPVVKTLVSTVRALVQLMRPQLVGGSTASTKSRAYDMDKATEKLVARGSFPAIIKATTMIIQRALGRSAQSLSSPLVDGTVTRDHTSEEDSSYSPGRALSFSSTDSNAVPGRVGGASPETKLWAQVLRLLGALASCFPNEMLAHWPQLLKDSLATESVLTTAVASIGQCSSLVAQLPTPPAYLTPTFSATRHPNYLVRIAAAACLREFVEFSNASIWLAQSAKPGSGWSGSLSDKVLTAVCHAFSPQLLRLAPNYPSRHPHSSLTALVRTGFL